MILFSGALIFLFSKGLSLNTAPVLILDYENSLNLLQFEPKPLQSLSSGEFSSILETAKRVCHGVILFLEDKLTTEDITSKDIKGTPFKNLRDGISKQKVKYLPNVNSPYDTIVSIFPTNSQNQISVGLGIPLELADQSYIYVNFADNKNDTQITKLRNHDVLMQQIYFMYRQTKSGPVVAFYTGKFDPLRELNHAQLMGLRAPWYRRYTAPVHPLTNFKVKTDKVIIMVGGVTNSNRRAFGVPLVTENEGDEEIQTRLHFVNFDLMFNVHILNGSWKLASVKLYEDGVLVGNDDINVGAPTNWSYFCAQPLSVKSRRNGVVYTVARYQLQPIIYARDGTNDTFDNPYNCAKYVTAPIVTCLFATGVLLACLFYGLVWVSNINTNSKFDDPLGKMVTFGERA